MHPGLRAARGEEPADLVYTNLTLFNPFTAEWEETSFAVSRGIVVGIGEYAGVRTIDFSGAHVIPGLIDAHVHIESSLLSPAEFGRLVLKHGTTTVIADPHEIANVLGTDGISYMLRERSRTPLDIFFMLPSCVPATPRDLGGAALDAGDLEEFVGRDGILGLGEMMNVPGVLLEDPAVWEKLCLCSCIDGHAPLLRGKDLCGYILAGIQSDHESTTPEEAREKLRRGMYLLIREGSTERNLRDLLPVINAYTAPRCAFATDDRHADLLYREGHIDDCIRKAVEYGLEPEIAFRMATLSAAERFGLHDRGAIAPGRVADFCVVGLTDGFTVERTFVRGEEVRALRPIPVKPIGPVFRCSPVTADDIRIAGSGVARVIGIVENQLITEELNIPVDNRALPDLTDDILKAVVCDRYRRAGCGVGFVHGFSFSRGAIAGSVSHDSHNIVAVGTNDADILRAIHEVIRHNGGLVAATDDAITVLPLECGGIMSARPYEEVVKLLDRLRNHTDQMGGVRNPFMYLSFLALTVIPHLRLTERGLFDVDRFIDVDVFVQT